MKVTNRCQVSVSIEKFYRNLLPVMLWIWTCAIFFMERTWKHDVDATQEGRDNIYVFTWKGKRVAIRLIPPLPESMKKMVSSLISLCHQLDRNSRVSSFEEGGTNVGEPRRRSRPNNGPGRTPVD